MKKTIVKLSNPQKLLLVINELAKGSKKLIPYVDIVVRAFKKYKKDFHLPGYPNYPDSEMVNKELYRDSTKKNGLISYGNKSFSLTDKGLDYVSKLKQVIKGKQIYSLEKIDRYVTLEIKRIKNLDSFKNFINGNLDLILDTDLYDYLGVTVRTEKNDFLGRLNTIKGVAQTMSRFPNDEFNTLLKFHKYMVKKFSNEIKYKLES